MRELAFLLLAALFVPMAHSQTLQQARAFLQDIYYWDTKEDAGDPLTDAKAYTPSLIRIFEHDRRKAGRGYVGKLDWDPLCSCQDPAGLKATIEELHRRNKASLWATVSLRAASGPPMTVRLLLRWTVRGWRIDDAGRPGIPSLRRLLQSR